MAGREGEVMDTPMLMGEVRVPTGASREAPQLSLVELARVAEREAAEGKATRITAEEVEDDAPADAIAPAPPWLPPRFHGATFSGFEVETPSQGKALAAARTFVERALTEKGVMLALIGPPGVGKSHLLYAIARALITKGQRVYARPWYRLADELRYGGPSPFAEKKLLEAPDVRRMLWSERIVLIDEVRPTASTAFDDTELAKLACHAYDQDAALLITTNVNPLKDAIGDAAASRFTQIVIDGPDHRRPTPTLARSA